MGGRILIVDDLAFTRTIYRDVLKSGGYTDLYEASDAATALDIMKKEKPDLVILDVILPDRTDLSTLREMQEIQPGCKVIICSAVNQMALIQQAVKLGVTDYFIKPVDGKVLLESVTKNIS